MGTKLIVSDFYENHLLGFYLKDGEPFKIEDLAESNIVGNVYCGMVCDVVKNIDACFVELGKTKGFLSTRKRKKPLKQGDKVLVQVQFDAMKTKDYGLTEHITLKGDYLVLTVGNPGISISQKISDTTSRNQLKSYLLPYANEEYGFIIRTKSEHVSETVLIQEAEALIESWNETKRKFEHSTPKEILHQEHKVLRVAKDFLEQYDGEIISDHDTTVSLLQSEKIPVRMFETGKISLSNLYRLDQVIAECLGKKVWMKSGAYLIFEHTEALNVIDVNSGKIEIKGEKEEIVYRINQEAVNEIAKQISLRNISGIILIDFINMKQKERQEMLLKQMNEQLKSQSVFAKAFGFTHLGLMELSRKKTDKPLHEIVHS